MSSENVPPPSVDAESKETSDKKLSPAEEQERRIQASTAKTQEEEATRYLIDACAKIDWQAPNPMPAKPDVSLVDLADSEKADPAESKVSGDSQKQIHQE